MAKKKRNNKNGSKTRQKVAYRATPMNIPTAVVNPHRRYMVYYRLTPTYTTGVQTIEFLPRHLIAGLVNQIFTEAQNVVLSTTLANVWNHIKVIAVTAWGPSGSTVILQWLENRGQAPPPPTKVDETTAVDRAFTTSRAPGLLWSVANPGDVPFFNITVTEPPSGTPNLGASLVVHVMVDVW